MTAEALPIDRAKVQEKPYSYWREVRRRLWRSRSARIGLIVIAVELVIAFVGPLLMVYDPIDYRDPSNKVRTPPCIHLLGCPAEQTEHIFGLDSNGRDLFTRVVNATRVSLFIGVFTVTFGIVGGTVIGIVWLHRRLDRQCVDALGQLLAFPGCCCRLRWWRFSAR
jgi:ABC-type dipeptide/oligopeptide/nickel transport system permease subunit